MAYIQVGVAVTMILASATAAAPKAPDGKDASAKAPATTDQTKYCVESEPFTGSRTIKTECKTRAEWAKEGVNVDQLKTR